MSRGQNALDAQLVIGGYQRMVVKVINSVYQQSLALPLSGFCTRDRRAIYNQVYYASDSVFGGLNFAAIYTWDALVLLELLYFVSYLFFLLFFVPVCTKRFF